MATQQRLTDVPEHMGCEDEEPGDMFAGPDPHSVAWALEEEERRNAEHERMLRQDEDTLRFEHEQRDDPPSTMDSEHNDWHAEHGNNGPCPYDCAACDPDNWYTAATTSQSTECATAPRCTTEAQAFSTTSSQPIAIRSRLKSSNGLLL